MLLIVRVSKSIILHKSSKQRGAPSMRPHVARGTARLARSGCGEICIRSFSRARLGGRPGDRRLRRRGPPSGCSTVEPSARRAAHSHHATTHPPVRATLTNTASQRPLPVHHLAPLWRPPPTLRPSPPAYLQVDTYCAVHCYTCKHFITSKIEIVPQYVFTSAASVTLVACLCFYVSSSRSKTFPRC